MALRVQRHLSRACSCDPRVAVIRARFDWNHEIIQHRVVVIVLLLLVEIYKKFKSSRWENFARAAEWEDQRHELEVEDIEAIS